MTFAQELRKVDNEQFACLFRDLGHKDDEVMIEAWRRFIIHNVSPIASLLGRSMEDLNPLDHLHTLVISDVSTPTKFRYRLGVTIIGMPDCDDLRFHQIFDGKPEFAREVREKFFDVFPGKIKRKSQTKYKK